ncbi:MAG TPA: type II toxin-antitoxin system VapC family toxin [Steroidobacteraceae bacterium]|nr:type II toxin-antitoxin system VapC family toxin [Steroidobacteraceae bacterium]
MAVPLIVPDASVLLKWVLPSDDEPDTDRALQLRTSILEESVRSLLPSLWLYEVGNTIARRFPAHAVSWMSALMKFELKEAPPTPVWLTTTLELTSKYEVTFYDAAYHALALIHKGTFVTADTRYVKKVADDGNVVALSDWSTPSRR